MKIRLGYVALPVTLPITSSSTVTYTYYQRVGIKKGNEKLDQVIRSNFEALQEILKYNIRNEVTFFRMTCNLLPLVTHPQVHYEVWTRYQSQFKEIGEFIRDNHMRVDLHPDQFCVLNSVHEEVVASTVTMLEFYQTIIEALQIDAVLVLHIGGKAGGKKEAMKRFETNFKKLNPQLQKIIVLENDDKVFNIRNTLSLCEKLNIPMVLDYHHFLCNRNQEKIEDFIERIFQTWKERSLNPKLHFSSPKNKSEKRSHHDYIDSEVFLSFLEKIKFTNQDIDIMIEAKQKEEALFRLIREIRYKTDYKFENYTSFYI